MPHAMRSTLSARRASDSQPELGVTLVFTVLINVAGAVDGSRKKSLAWPARTQLVTSIVWIFGKPTFPPGTTAIAVPLAPAHWAPEGIVAVMTMSPTSASPGAGSPATVRAARTTTSPRARHHEPFRSPA